MNRAIFHTLIQNLLHDYKGGSEFFDALDENIRTNSDILQLFIDFILENIKERSRKHTTLILSGEFWCALISMYGKLLYDTFHHVLLVKGDLRKQGNLKYIYMKQRALWDTYIFLDDSYYAWKTKNIINTALQTIHSDLHISKTLVLYDGSLIKDENVISLYRYHP